MTIYILGLITLTLAIYLTWCVILEMAAGVSVRTFIKIKEFYFYMLTRGLTLCALLLIISVLISKLATMQL